MTAAYDGVLPVEFRAFIRDETARLAGVIRNSNIVLGLTPAGPAKKARPAHIYSLVCDSDSRFHVPDAAQRVFAVRCRTGTAQCLPLWRSRISGAAHAVKLAQTA